MDATTITGITASVFTASSLLPQLFKLIKEKKGEQVSKGMLAVLFVGLILWVVYGLLRSDPIIAVSNGFSLLVNILIFILSFKYKHGSSIVTK